MVPALEGAIEALTDHKRSCSSSSSRPAPAADGPTSPAKKEPAPCSAPKTIQVLSSGSTSVGSGVFSSSSSATSSSSQRPEQAVENKSATVEASSTPASTTTLPARPPGGARWQGSAFPCEEDDEAEEVENPSPDPPPLDRTTTLDEEDRHLYDEANDFLLQNVLRETSNRRIQNRRNRNLPGATTSVNFFSPEKDSSGPVFSMLPLPSLSFVRDEE
ncbi:unnamed protein product [Amoebophrya sp. A120]|nr:unnamed protein product [Amoebophrya sp. A120]|eukprot:GSA120T00020902001.1